MKNSHLIFSVFLTQTPMQKVKSIIINLLLLLDIVLLMHIFTYDEIKTTFIPAVCDQ